jgi:putative transposase
MRKMMKYRLYPTTAQSEALDAQLGEACRLYNAALQERRDAYQRNGLSLSYYDQANQLKDIRTAGDLGLANFSASQDVLRRVDKTFKAFFVASRLASKLDSHVSNPADVLAAPRSRVMAMAAG